MDSRQLTIGRGIERPSRTARAGHGHSLRPGCASRTVDRQPTGGSLVLPQPLAACGMDYLSAFEEGGSLLGAERLVCAARASHERRELGEAVRDRAVV